MVLQSPVEAAMDARGKCGPCLLGSVRMRRRIDEAELLVLGFWVEAEGLEFRV